MWRKSIDIIMSSFTREPNACYRGPTERTYRTSAAVHRMFACEPADVQIEIIA